MSMILKALVKRPHKAPPLFSKFDLFEAKLCIQINRWGHNKDIRTFFCTVSRLGDGVFWYSLLAIYALVHGFTGIFDVLVMSTIGITCVLIYKVLKGVMVRERPFISFGEITAHTAPLDQYSFPSGHTMNAICFVVLFSHYEPTSIFLVLPFAILVAISRVILGVHYISDVIVGAVLGLLIGNLGLEIFS